MFNLFRAEWYKVTGNRWVAGCMIWIFPIGAFGFVLVIAAILALSSTFRESFNEEPTQWTDQAITVWELPNDPTIGRLILVGFTAVVFAGEYQWGTWKSVVPRNRRLAIILTKFFTVGAFVIVAFVVMSIILALGSWLLVAMAGGTYGPKPTGEVIRNFIGDYTLQAATSFTAVMIAAGYAALAAMLTRSILGGVVAGVIITAAEGLSILALIIVGSLFDIPKLVLLYRLTPTYNLLNVTSWLRSNEPNAINFENFAGTDIYHSDTLLFSLVVLAMWMVGLISLTSGLFQRQDITS